MSGNGGEWTDVGRMERNKERFNEFVDYWKEVARNVKAIGHTDAENHVVRYAQMQMFEPLAVDARSPILGIETPSKEYVGHEQGDDLLADWVGAIVIAEEVELGNSADRDAVIDRCHHIWDLCMAKVRKDVRTNPPRLYYFDFNTKAIPVREIFRNMAGVRVPIRMRAQFSLAMNPEDYLNEDITGPEIPYAKVYDNGQEILLGPNGMHTCSLPAPCADADIELLDADGNTIDTFSAASGQPVQRTVASGEAVVKNSADAELMRFAVNAGGGETEAVLPDVEHTDTDGSPVSLPAQEPMVCSPAAPATWQLVNTATPDPDELDSGIIAAGGHVSITAPPVTVLRDGQPYMIQPAGTEVDVPSDCAPKTVGIAVDDDTPAFGQTVTLTATPSGFTPTAYMWWAWRAGTGIESATLIGSSSMPSLAWTVDVLGVWNVMVNATDGTDTAFNTVGVAVTTMQPETNSGLLAWWDASDPATVTIGTGVSALADKSGNGRTLAQAAGASQPAYVAGYQNGLNAIAFDGVNDFLATAAAVLSGTTWYAIAAVRVVASSNINSFLSQFTSAAAGRFTMNCNQNNTGAVTSGHLNPFLGGAQAGPLSATSVPSFPTGATSVRVFEIFCEAGLFSCSMNGETRAIGFTSTAILNTVLRAGSSDGVGGFFDGHFFEAWAASAVPSKEMRLENVQYLRNKWAI